MTLKNFIKRYIFAFKLRTLFLCTVWMQGAMFLYALAPDDTNDGRSRSDKKIELIHSDILYKNSDDPRADVLVGNVALSHEGAFLYCDSAKYYKDENSFDAFGHVKMVQGDTLSLNSDTLYYNGLFMTAKARGRVQLDHKKTRLVTEHLDYDRIYDVGMFMNGGTLYDGENVLVSDWGQYTPYLNEAFFTDNVELTNPNFTMVSDTLFYNSATEIAKIVSPTNINAKDGTFVYGLRGNYDTRNGTADLMDRSYIIRDMRKIVADSMHYNKELAVSEAFRNVVVTDDENLSMLKSNYCMYNDSTGYFMATDSAVVMEYSSGDTLYIHGDTLKMFTYNMDTDSVYRHLHCYHKVRMYRSDIQAVCDSMVSKSEEYCTYLYGQPIIWNVNQQLFGEEIRVYNNDSTIDSVHVINQAMTVEQLDSMSYNQVAGKEMFSYFRDGEVYRSEAHGNVYVVYYMAENDGTRIGVNYTETSKLILYLKDKKVEKIWMPASVGTMYPLEKTPADKSKLSGFAWFDYIRPKDKNDIFVWRSKSADKMLKTTEKRVVPLQKLENIK